MSPSIISRTARPAAPPRASRTFAGRVLTALAAWATLLGTGPHTTHAGVVINEIMYHPPDDRDEYQWVELWNPDTTAVDLAGWSFRKGFKFTFTNSLPLPPGGFLVVSADAVAFRLRYGTNIPVVGDFSGRLSHSGESIELANREGQVVDRVKYDDAPPWPVSPDGMSASLERLRAGSPGEDPLNWDPSPLPALRSPAGTPGRTNAASRSNPPPEIAEVQFGHATPGQPLKVTARVADPDGVRGVRLAYQVLPPSAPPGPAPRPPRGAPSEPAKEIEVPMTGEGGLYTAQVPAQSQGALVRFRVKATDGAGSERIAPHPHDARPAWTVYFGSLPGESRIPQVALIQQGPIEQAGPNLRTEFQPGPRRRTAARTTPARGESVVVYQAPGEAQPTVYDFVRIVPRQGGWKVRLHKDKPLEQMSTVNVIFEYQPRFVLSEFLAYELYRAAGAPTPLSGHWRVTHNGRPMGYHLFVEQPNATFLRRVGLEDDGDLYKILWYGRDLVGQHEKKNNPASGHVALAATVEALGQSQGAAQWKFIQEAFDVDACANYYAVNQCIQNWDGFFNNHFVYRHPGHAGKWALIPWDEDKTWGDYDGASPKYDWYGMPLTYGMAGDKPPRSFGPSMGIHGGPSWWRQGGWFSSPLLANPQFRARFLARLRELCSTTFTPEKFGPVIDGLEHRLEPEVRFRASSLAGRAVAENGWTASSEFQKTDPEEAAEQFRRHIGSYRNQLKHRREFLLQELGKAGVK